MLLCYYLYVILQEIRQKLIVEKGINISLSNNIKSQMSCLELILGPMFSGKTTYLIETYNEYIKLGKQIAVINYAEDTRYHDKMLSSHDQVMIPCIFSNTIKETFRSDEVIAADVVLINEGQFFPDLLESVTALVEKYQKRVYVCGLDGDFKRKRFGTLLDLIPLCDKVTKLTAKCSVCNKNALFSHRISQENEQIVIGVSNYIPLCRICYVNRNEDVAMKPASISCHETEWIQGI